MSEIVQAPSSDLFAHCPSGCVCGVRELAAREFEYGPRAADEVDAAKMRSLLTAVRSGYETVRSDPRLAERRHAASLAYDRAERQLNRMQIMLAERGVDHAVTELADSERRVRVEGKRRPTWLRWVRWPTVIGIGLFDVWYFSQVFRYLTSQTGDASAGGSERVYSFMETVVAVVPGLVLAIVIAVSGHLLLWPLRAWREAAFGRKSEPSTDGRRKRFSMAAIGRWMLRLSWMLLPIAFVGFLLMVIAVWAALRAKFPTPPSDGYPLLSVMLLIVLLAVGTMAVKIIAEDPAADELVAARRRVRRLRWHYLWQANRADRFIGDYDSAWRDLRTLRDDLVGLLRIKMLSAWEGFILRVRSLHRMAGNVVASPWPVGREPSTPLQEFVGIPQPALELGPLTEICRLIDERPPDALRKRKEDLDAAYAGQVAYRAIAAGQPAQELPTDDSEEPK